MSHVADHGDQGDGGGHVDTGDGEQTTHVFVAFGASRAMKWLIAASSCAEEVELAQGRVGCEALVDGKLPGGEPGAALAAEEVTRRRTPLEVALQYRRDLVLDPGAALDEPPAARDQPAQQR